MRNRGVHYKKTFSPRPLASRRLAAGKHQDGTPFREDIEPHVAEKHRGIVRLESRTGRDMSGCFPEPVAEIQAIPHDFAADSEVGVLDNQSCPQWDRPKRRHAQRSLRRSSVPLL
jgi:hypothetical protein